MSAADFYTEIIRIRRTYPALRTGTFKTISAEGRVYAYLRGDDANRIVVVINNEEQPQSIELYLDLFGFANGAILADELGGGTYTVEESAVTLELEPLSGAILVER